MSNWKPTQTYKLKNGDRIKEWENSRNGKVVRLEQYTNHNEFLRKNPEMRMGKGQRPKSGFTKTPKDWRVTRGTVYRKGYNYQQSVEGCQGGSPLCLPCCSCCRR